MLAPFSLQHAPSLMEVIFPVQRLSAEVFKERQSGSGQTLTPLGSYWKGRKPLILNKACVLGTLLPATGDDVGDLRLFERLMGMDPQALQARLWRRKWRSVTGAGNSATRIWYGKPNGRRKWGRGFGRASGMR